MVVRPSPYLALRFHTEYHWGYPAAETVFFSYRICHCVQLLPGCLALCGPSQILEVLAYLIFQLWFISSTQLLLRYKQGILTSANLPCLHVRFVICPCPDTYGVRNNQKQRYDSQRVTVSRYVFVNSPRVAGSKQLVYIRRVLTKWQVPMKILMQISGFDSFR